MPFWLRAVIDERWANPGIWCTGSVNPVIFGQRQPERGGVECNMQLSQLYCISQITEIPF
jgi:hypothetical protein